MAMPYLVPSQLRENNEAWKVFEAWNKPFLCAFTDGDPITKGGEQAFLSRVPGAQNITLRGAGHFVQEDAGPNSRRSSTTSLQVIRLDTELHDIIIVGAGSAGCAVAARASEDPESHGAAD